MIIITKTSKAAARSVSVEQITEAAMAIVQNVRLEFIPNITTNRWRWCHKCSTSSSASISKNNSLTNSNSLSKLDINSMNCSQNRLHRSRLHRHRHHHNRHQNHSHNFGCSLLRQFITIGLIGMVLFVNCPIFVVAAGKNTIRSIANSDGNDPYRTHSNWFEFQRQSLNQRSLPTQSSQSQEFGNIFTQLGFFIQSRQRNATEIAGNIFFKYYNTEGDLLYESNLSKPQDLLGAQCHPNDRFAILMHGWRESCNTTWMKQLIKKLGTYRGGCIICMDYSRYAAESYVRLVRVFDPMAQVLTLQLHLLDYMGFDMNNGYMFGFSYGGQLATEAGRRFGAKRLKEIDTCDMAGPGFDHRSTQPDHRDAAQNVQCIHTSRDKGTRFYNCHQDWRLGNCGLTQVASNSPPLGSHGLCPYMYVNAFDHDFYAIDKPSDCVSKRMAKYWPQNFKMGYMENRKWQVSGELFAQTSRFHPFNIVGNSSSAEHGTDSTNIISKELYQRDVSASSVAEVLHPNSNALQRLKERILKYIFQDHIFN